MKLNNVFSNDKLWFLCETPTDTMILSIDVYQIENWWTFNLLGMCCMIPCIAGSTQLREFPPSVTEKIISPGGYILVYKEIIKTQYRYVATT